MQKQDAERPTRRGWTRAVIWAARTLIAVWGGFWIWFNTASGIYEGGGAGWWHGAIALVVLALSVVGWRWSTLGGVLFILGGALAAIFFRHPAAFALFATPMLVIGMLLIVANTTPRRGMRLGGPAPTA